MSWRLAKSLEVFIDQLIVTNPSVPKSSFGTIGDQAHRNRISDHNPNKQGVVCAVDVPTTIDCEGLAEALRSSQDARIKYVIWNRRAFEPAKFGWTWQPYSGSDPHTGHLHLSVYKDYDNTAPWQIGDNVYPTKEDLERVSAKVGFPRDAINQQDLDYWTKGIDNNLWSRGPGTVWRALNDASLSKAEKTIATLDKRPTQKQLDEALNKPPKEVVVEIPADLNKLSVGDLLSALWKKIRGIK